MLDCPRITLLPQAFRDAEATFLTFAALADSFVSFAQVSSSVATLGDLMEGHPGWPSGTAVRPVGSGFTFGEVRNNVEWWVTQVEGLEGSGRWTARTMDPAVGDGTWLLETRGGGRQITLTGMLLSGDRVALQRAVDEAAAAMAAPPRTGWLLWTDDSGLTRRIPTAHTAPVKVRRIGGQLAEVQFELTGVDVGSPGSGVYLESPDPQYIQLWNDGTEMTVQVPGTVPTPPTITVTGPVASGATISLGAYTITLNRAVAADHVLTIDCGNKVIFDNGEPDRAAVTLGLARWPVLPTGLVNVSAVYSPEGVPADANWRGAAAVQIVGLW